MTAFLFSLILVLASHTYSPSTGRNNKIGDKLLKNPEHHIKAIPDILNRDCPVLHTGWYFVVDTPNKCKRLLDKSDETYYLDPKPIITAKNITTFKIYQSPYSEKKEFGLIMRLDKEGTKSWSNATLKATGSKLAFILDNRLLQVAMVNSQITGGVTAFNAGVYSKQELENLKSRIEAEK